MAEVQAENKKLVEPLQKANDQVAELQRQLSSYDKDKALLASTKLRLKETEDSYNKLEWKHEVFNQRFDNVDIFSKLFFSEWRRFLRFFKFFIDCQRKR
jgi:hypothetical protein